VAGTLSGKKPPINLHENLFPDRNDRKGGRVQEYEQLRADIGNGTLKPDVSRWR
jgi:hypothetical protein